MSNDAKKEAVKEKPVEAVKEKPVEAVKATWDNAPKKEMTRVFRVLKPPTLKVLVTLMQKKRTVDGLELDELTVKIKPTSAQQYVLEAGAIGYDDQLVALRSHVDKGFIEETDPKLIGVPWIPKEQVELAAAEALVKKLKALI